MTDKEQIQQAYAKVKQKYPDVTDKETLDALAIRHFKNHTLLYAFLWLALGIGCGLGYLFLRDGSSSSSYIMLVTAVSGVFEFFHLLSRLSKADKLFHPVLTVTDNGTLTRKIVLKDGGLTIKKDGGTFRIVKTPLVDKEDDQDSTLDNHVFHRHILYFTPQADGERLSFRVWPQIYDEAVIGAQYYIVLSAKNNIAAIYQTTNWKLGGDIMENYENTDGYTPVAPSATYTDPGIPTKQKEKTKLLLPILGLVLMAVSYFTPVIIGAPLAIAALVLSIVGIVRQRSGISITSLVVNVVLFLLLILSIWAMFNGFVEV